MVKLNFLGSYLIVEAQLTTFWNRPATRMHDSEALAGYSTTITNVVSVFKHYKFKGGLPSSATRQFAIKKLPPNQKEKWWFYVDETNENRKDRCLLEK